MTTPNNALRHKDFVQVFTATLAESKQALTIRYGVGESPFGPFFLATTAKGVCRASFVFDNDLAPEFEYLKKRWPKASFQQDDAWAQEQLQHWFALKETTPQLIRLHLVGTHFQQQVWQALLDIPLGQTTSYGALAAQLKRPKAFRAVGTAVGNNPITFLIPCHRVLQQSGALGGYFWGVELKRQLLAWEQ